MTTSRTPLVLDFYNQSKVELWQTAAIELAGGPEHTDLFVQTALHVVLAWLRTEAARPILLLELFGRPHGPLGRQLRLVGSLLVEPGRTPVEQVPRLWWLVVKAAYHARWLELTAEMEPRA